MPRRDSHRIDARTPRRAPNGFRGPKTSRCGSRNPSGRMYYKNKYWAGFGFRVSLSNLAALTFLGGVELMNGLNVGYALDINTGSIFLGGATSHEILVTYSFNLDTKRNHKYKSVRYL